jgi:phosphohistidine phosphatase
MVPRSNGPEAPMIELYVVRHGIAVEADPGTPDAFRTLTRKGRRRFQKTAEAFGRRRRKLDLVLTSPLVRAVQTAEILAGATDPGDVAVLAELDPSNGADSLLQAVAKRAGKSRSVALVGHEPQLSSVIAALSGVAQDQLDVKKGAIVRIDVAALPKPESVSPRWWLKPRSGNRVKGLPLQTKDGSAADTRSVSRRGRKAKTPAGASALQ